jgi:hypothetical protein
MYHSCFAGPQATILYRVVCEVLPKVEMLSTLTSPEGVVALLLDGRVPLRRECHILEERSEVDDFHRRCRCCHSTRRASAVESAVVLCSFVFPWIGAPLYRKMSPVVERRGLPLPLYCRFPNRSH